MYHFFDHYAEVQAFLALHETARVVGWPYGRYGRYSIFIPLEKS
jgi:hypothetical protein